MTRIVFQRADGKPAGAPLRLPNGRRRLSEIARWHGDASRPFLVSVHHRRDPLAVNDQTVRLRRHWSRTKVGRKQVVVITYLPQGGGAGRSGGGAGKTAGIGLLVATIALAAVGQFWAIGALNGALGLAATSAVGGTIWAAGSAIALAGGAYLMSKATQAKANKTDDRPVYGVSGGGNLPRSGDRIPVLYGRCWTVPDLSQPDYTVNSGDDQILFKRLTVGLGAYQVATIRVAGAVMWTSDGGVQSPFDGAEVDIVNPGEASDLVPGQVLSVEGVTGGQIPKPADNPAYLGPFDFGSSATQQSRIQLDYSLPQGVFSVPQSGKYENKQYPTQWGVRFDYAASDANGNPIGPWQVLHQDGAYVLLTRAQRFTVFKDIAPGRYLFRAQNTGTPDEASSNPDFPELGFTAKATNIVSWDGLRSHLPETIIRPHVTEIAMRIRSGKALGITAFGNVEVEVQRMLPVWNGGAWVDTPTRKAVWAYADILRNADYGGGIDAAEIDLGALLHYAQQLAQFDTYDGVIRGPVSVYEAATTVLGVMRASPVRLGSVWSLARDEQKAVRRHVISRRQILKDTTGEVYNLDLSDGSADVIVEWKADGDPKRLRSQRVTYGTVTNVPRRMQAEGVSTAEHAIHLARWAAASAYYRRVRRSVSVELAGRLVMPNDGALIDSWYFDGYQTAGVLDRDGLTLLLDTEIEALPATPYVMLRARDGREWGPVAITAPDATTIDLDAADVDAAETQSGLTLAQVLATETQALTTAVIGSYAEVRENWLVRSLRFSGSTRVDIEAVEDAPEVWAALAEPIVAPPAPPSRALDEGEAVRIAWVRAGAVQRGAAMMMEWAVAQARIPVNYAVQLSYDEGATWEDVYRGPASSGSYPIRDTDQIIRVRAWAASESGLISPVVTTEFRALRALLSSSTALMRIDLNDILARFRGQLERPFDMDMLAQLWNVSMQAMSADGKSEAGIKRAELVEATESSARAVLAEEVYALVGDAQAAVTSVNQAVVNLNAQMTAVASATTEAVAKANGVSASGQFSVSAGAGPGGATAQLRLRAAATSGGGLVDAGMLIDVIGGLGRVGIVANQFVVLDPSFSSPRTVFAYAGTDIYLGSDVKVAGNLIVQGSITSLGIASGAVSRSANAARGDDVHAPGSPNSTVNGGAWADYTSVTVPIYYDGRVEVKWEAQGLVTVSGGSSAVHEVRMIRRTGAGEVQLGRGYSVAAAGTGSATLNYFPTVRDQPGIGEVAYVIQHRVNSGAIGSNGGYTARCVYGAITVLVSEK